MMLPAMLALTASSLSRFPFPRHQSPHLVALLDQVVPSTPIQMLVLVPLGVAWDQPLGQALPMVALENPIVNLVQEVHHQARRRPTRVPELVPVPQDHLQAMTLDLRAALQGTLQMMTVMTATELLLDLDNLQHQHLPPLATPLAEAARHQMAHLSEYPLLDLLAVLNLLQMVAAGIQVDFHPRIQTRVAQVSLFHFLLRKAHRLR